MKRAAFIAYLIALHLAVGAWFVKRSTYLQPESQIVAVVREAHRQMDSSVPSGAVIFLGDSITMALAVSAVADRSVNYGIGLQRSDQLLESMRLYHSMGRASAVVVTIGANDVAQGRIAGIAERYSAIVAAIPAAVPVVVNSASPLPTLPAQSVRVVNAAAVAACKARSNCTFLDLHELLAPGGSLRDGVLLPDRVHLTPSGYALWIAALRRALSHSTPNAVSASDQAVPMMVRPALFS